MTMMARPPLIGHNLSYKNDMLQLTANGSPIGNAVEIKSSGGSGSGGDGTTDGNMRVVEF